VMVELTHAPEPMAAQVSREALGARPLMRRALADAYRHMDAVLVLGQRSRRQLLRAWPEAGRVEVIPHGDERIFLRDGVATPDRCPPRVLLFGTLTWYKGADLLLDAFQLVRAALPEAELVIAGAVARDVDFDGLARRASEIGGVTLRPGYVPSDRVAELFGGARVVVAPYRIANQSGVVHLAQSFGRPVVATDVGDLREAVLHEQTGLLVPADDPPAFAAALTRLLRDPDGAARLGRVGEQRLAAEASWAEVAARVVPLYQELVDARRDRNHHHA
jgi:glycosyltransferase involved in cell wall biosynthesis